MTLTFSFSADLLNGVIPLDNLSDTTKGSLSEKRPFRAGFRGSVLKLPYPSAGTDLPPKTGAFAPKRLGLSLETPRPFP